MKTPIVIDEAISHFAMGITHNIFNEPVTSYANLAIEALRQMQEKEQNEPPTLDELRKGVDYPLYTVYPKNSGKDHWVIEDCWDTEFDEMCDAKGNAWYGCYYGITWLAYRRKPEGSENE